MGFSFDDIFRAAVPIQDIRPSGNAKGFEGTSSFTGRREESAKRMATILLVDEDPDHLMLFQNFLQRGDYQVITAPSAEASLKFKPWIKKAI